MKGILEFLILLGIGIGVALLLNLYSALKIWLLKHKWASIIAVFKEFGYIYCSSIRSKRKGVIYRKQIDKETIESLLIRYRLNSIELSVPYKVYDYVALIDFPNWEERYFGIVYVHGGLRILHFYSLEVNLNNKTYRRPISQYLSNDMLGTEIEPFMRKSTEYIESIINSEQRDILRIFIADEIEYWQNNMDKISN
ncbi:MAG: hypothetical protein K2M13_08465 [Muribaculaceae bacterium]|nr:hypothetical protein [Muribaculaceae bacterium]